MGTLWKRLNQNSGGLVVVLMAITIIVGPSVFVWTEVHVNSSEIRALQENVGELRDDIRVLREEIGDLETVMRTEMERNQQQLIEALIGHIHDDDDGSAIFKAPVDTSQ